MRRTLFVFCLLTSAACGDDAPVQCSTSSECNSHPEGVCLPAPSGNQWCAYEGVFGEGCSSGSRWSDQAGDGLAGMCVAAADGGVADGASDAPIADGAVDGAVDAGPETDAGPGEPPLSSGQSADLVLGQVDFTTITANSNGESYQSFSTPIGVATQGTRLWVTDSANARALQWNSLPAVNRQAANLVLGQLSAIMHTDGLTQELLGVGLGGAFSDGTNLVVADTANNRVLIWNGIPTGDGEPADRVLCQGSFTSSGSGAAANQCSGPGAGIWTDGTRLIITDTFNSRVLIWNTFPTTNGQAANVVLGWPDFGSSGPPIDPPTASSLARPRGVYFDGTRLYVADTDNHRVLVWNGIPTVSGEAADFVIGQTAFDNGGPNASGASASDIGLNSPQAVGVAFGSLFICDDSNHRLVVHTPIPSTNGEAADAVVGRPDLFTAGNAAPAQNTMESCRGLAIAGDKLFVSDSGWHRVLRFDLHP